MIITKISVVANTDNSNYSRMAACLQIKNCLKSNSANVQQNHHRNWLQIGQQDRIEIKNNAFSALGSEQKYEFLLESKLNPF